MCHSKLIVEIDQKSSCSVVVARTMESETKQNAFHFSRGLLLSNEGVVVVISSENVNNLFLTQKNSLNLPKSSSMVKMLFKVAQNT